MKKNNFKFDKDKLFEALSKRAEGFFYSEEILEYGEREEKVAKSKKSDGESDVICDKLNDVSKEKCEDCVSKMLENQKPDIYSGRETSEAEEQEREQDSSKPRESGNERLVLLKKKVATHYVPPDMSAIKMLFEVCGEEIVGRKSVIENMSDEELLKMREELLEELKAD
ncbi:MAG: hypothetical protein IJW24_03560 [Clostridia bacterium]|nr:hypothetical protein [Clostridia bacterium]